MAPLESLIHLRPYLYHLTAASNIPHIRKIREIHSAARLFELAHRQDLASVRRKNHKTITVEGEQVTIRDQAPLHPGNVTLGSNWSFGDLVAELNRFVFFWPGNAISPIGYGLRHFQRYRKEDICILCIPFLDLVSANPRCEPFVCRYNSGSPRCSGGKPSPRSAETFRSINRSKLRPGQVVEVAFTPSITLPMSCKVGTLDLKAWVQL